VQQLGLPSGVQVTFVGFATSQNEASRLCLLRWPVYSLRLYVLASQFGSFLQPFVIMLAMPFSFIGAFLRCASQGSS